MNLQVWQVPYQIKVSYVAFRLNLIQFSREPSTQNGPTNDGVWVGLQQVEIKLAIFCDDIARGAVATTPNSTLLTTAADCKYEPNVKTNMKQNQL